MMMLLLLGEDGRSAADDPQSNKNRCDLFHVAISHDTTSLLTNRFGWFINVGMTPVKKKAPARKKAAAKPSPKKKPAASKSVSKKKSKASSPKPGKDELGRVIAFFRIPVVAVIKITQGSLKIGERVWIKGHTTDLKQTITSMQVNHQPILEAKKGDELGIKTSSRARRGDRVYRITS